MPKPLANDELTDDHLRAIMPNAPKARRVESLPILNAVMRAYEINNERRAAAWLATLAVESGELKYQQEIASGAAYEGREDLGNTEPGDGKRFKGHGRIQITGRSNHAAYTSYLKKNKHLPFVDFVKSPSLLAEEPYATDSAGWFWAVLKNLNPLADNRQFLNTQIKVNGRNKKTGLPNHWDERRNYYERALTVLPDDFLLEGAAPVDDVEPADIEKPRDDGTQTDSPASGAISNPAAKDVKISQMSPTTKTISFGMIGAAVLGFVKEMWTSSKSEVISAGQYAAEHLPQVVLVLGLAALGIWIYNQSARRAAERTKQIVEITSNPDKTDVVIK